MEAPQPGQNTERMSSLQESELEERQTMSNISERMFDEVHDGESAEMFVHRLNLETARNLLAAKQQEIYNIEANIAAMEAVLKLLGEEP